MKINIVRDTCTFGPYTLAEALTYFERGLLFEHDLAYEVVCGSSTAKSLLSVFKTHQVVPKAFSVWKQLIDIVQKEHALLFPWKRLVTAQWISDKQVVALWAGISGYFLGFSMLHGSKRWALRALAVLVPALLHATYNTFPGFISLAVAVISVILLMSYLGAGQQIQLSMKKPSKGTS